MTCEDGFIIEQIHNYFEGKLSFKEKTELYNHISTCTFHREFFESIAKVYQELKVQKNIIGFAADEKGTTHIPTSLLIGYSEPENKFINQVNLKIKSHLNTCSTCQEELKILNGMNQIFEEEYQPLKKLPATLKTRLQEIVKIKSKDSQRSLSSLKVAFPIEILKKEVKEISLKKQIKKKMIKKIQEKPQKIK